MADSDLQTELILRGRIARKAISLVGAFEGNELKELSGSVEIKASLSSVLNDLGVQYSEAATVLKQLVSGGENADIVLEKLGVGYHKSKTAKTVQLGLLLTIDGNRLQFALLKKLGASGYLVGLDLSVDNTAAPKNFLSGLIGDISIGNLGVYYASAAFDNVTFYSGDAFQDASVLSLKTGTGKSLTFPKGLKVSAEILVGGVNLLDRLAAPRTTTPTPATPPPPAKDETKAEAKASISAGTTVWIEAQKSIGPLSLRRVGLSYIPAANEKDPARIGVKLDAGLQLSFLTATLEGVGLTYPLKAPKSAAEVWENLQFGLEGASVLFSGGPLTIGGGLLKVDVPGEPDALQLDGSLLVGVDGLFTIAALGSYAYIKETPSLFIFAALQKELGGPAFFFVTGLAAGFGVNRALKLPAIEEVYNFPLIKVATDPNYLGKNLDLRMVSQKLGEYIYPSAGNYWVAAGVKFNSFGLIDSFAMITVSFGTQFQLGLLGLAKISVPKQLGESPLPPIACAELAIKVAFSPADGVLAVEARLTDNSFLFTKECRLTGGFAFYVWFNGSHAGDFVVTLGGYHALFKKPDHYPTVPRLRIYWPVSAELSITGEAYFALTPSCLMAGGKLDIVFQAGPIRAWFYARADFLIAWKPFYYDIDVAVRIGIAFQTELGALTFELGAAVHLWGPPFGGIAHVTLVVISFDIPFGKQEPATPEPLSWEEFHQSFLPQAQPGLDPVLNTIRITGGLLSEREIGEKDQKKTLRLVNAHEVSFSTESVIPSTEVAFNNRKAPDAYTSNNEKMPDAYTSAAGLLGVRPMGKNTLQSEHKVFLRRRGDIQKGWGDEYVDVKAVLKNVPHALWSKDLSRLSAPSAETIKNVPSGLQASLKTRDPSHGLSPIDLEKFQYDNFPKRIPWVEVKPPLEIPAHGERTLKNTIWNNPTVTPKRNAILRALGKASEIETVALVDFATNAERILQAMPDMARLGEPLKPAESL